MKSLSLATVFAALSGFIVLIVAGRTLGDEGYADFNAYWGLFFALTGLIDGLTHETTRGVSAVKGGASPGNARPWRFGAVLGVVMAAVVLLTSPLWIGALTSGGAGASTLLAIGLLSYTFQALLSGVLSGLELWPRYAGLVALDSGIRFVLSLVAWGLGWGLQGFFLITVIGAASWLIVLWGAPTSVSVDVSGPVFRKRVASAMAASGATAALITGFPVMLQITAEPGETLTGVTLGAVMAAVMLTRAPILVPVQRFQSAFIVRFVRDGSLTSLLKPLGLVFAVGLLGALAAWLVGPWLMVTIYGSDSFWVSGPFLALLTFASACTGSLIITGAAALASERHRLYVLGWVVASVVAFGVLALPLPLEVAVGGALIVGPLAGGLIHAAALKTRS